MFFVLSFIELGNCTFLTNCSHCTAVEEVGMLSLVKILLRDYISNLKLCPDSYLLCNLLKILKFIHLTCVGCLNGSLLG